MTLNVQLFAAARDLVGRNRVEVELPDAATIGVLREALASQFPALVSLMPHLLFAIGTDYAGDDAVLQADAEVAAIPPVSGG